MNEHQLPSGLWIPGGDYGEKSDRTQLATFDRGPLPDWSAVSKFVDYSSFLGAITIPWVYACTSVIGYNFAQTKFDFMDGEEIVDDPNSPLAQLFARPNPNQSRFQFLETLVTQLLLTGNAYITLEERDADGVPREMYLPNPARMRIKPGPHGVEGYIYEAAIGLGRMSSQARFVPYDPDEVIHIKMTNPMDDFYGFGVIEACQTLLDIVTAMAQHELSYWQSGGRITGVLETETKLDDRAFQRLKREWQMASIDRKQRVRTAILEQGLKYTPIAEGLRSLDLVNIDKNKRDQVLAAFGVPLPKIGIMEQAQYKMDEADAFFWQETMHPIFARVEDGLQPLVELFSPTIRLEFARKTFEDDQYKIQNANQMLSGGYCTIDEARALIGLDELPNGNGDVLLLNNLINPVRIDSIGKVADEDATPTPTPGAPVDDVPPDEDLPGMTDEEKDAVKKWRMRRKDAAAAVARQRDRKSVRTPMDRVRSLSTKKIGANGKLPDPPNRGSLRHPVIAEAVQRNFHRETPPLVEKATERLRSAFREQRKNLIERVNDFKAALSHRDPGKRRDAMRALLDPGPLRDAIVPIYAETAPVGARMARSILPPSKRASVRDIKATAYNPNEYPRLPVPDVIVNQFPNMGDKIDRRWQGIDDTTFDAIMTQIEVGIERGYSPLQIANGYASEEYDGITGVFDDALSWRADMIARTETANAYNMGAIQTYADAGVGQLEAIDGTEFDKACMERNGLLFDMDPQSGEVIDNGSGTEDHPNGTLMWIPISGSITGALDQ